MRTPDKHEKAIGKWDYFIAYAEEDFAYAAELCSRITAAEQTVFLDKKNIFCGDNWIEKTSEAQFQSIITIALISENTRGSHYAREEIAIAIDLAHRFPHHHKIIPIYLNDALSEGAELLYGLRLIKSIALSKITGFDRLMPQIFLALSEFKSQTAFSAPRTTFTHPLLAYPTGPLVPAELIPKNLMGIYAKLIRQAEMKLVVNKANSFRMEANPDTPYIIDLGMIISPDTNPAFRFLAGRFQLCKPSGTTNVSSVITSCARRSI